jgi:hypothetical protein
MAHISETESPLPQSQATDITIRNFGIGILGAFIGNRSAPLMLDNCSFPAPFGWSGGDDWFVQTCPVNELDIGWGRQAMDLSAGSRL